MIYSTKKSHYLSIFFGLCVLLSFSAFFPHAVSAHTDLNDICAGNPHRHSGIAQTDADVICAGDLDFTLATAHSATASIATLVNVLIGIVVSLAFLYFFWNLAKYIREENDQEEAKKKMGWSVLAIVVITSLWGLVAFVRNIIGIDAGKAGVIELPTVTKLSCNNLIDAANGLLRQYNSGYGTDAAANAALSRKLSSQVAAIKGRQTSGGCADLPQNVLSGLDAIEAGTAP